MRQWVFFFVGALLCCLFLYSLIKSKERKIRQVYWYLHAGQSNEKLYHALYRDPRYVFNHWRSIDKNILSSSIEFSEAIKHLQGYIDDVSKDTDTIEYFRRRGSIDRSVVKNLVHAHLRFQQTFRDYIAHANDDKCSRDIYNNGLHQWRQLDSIVVNSHGKRIEYNFTFCLWCSTGKCDQSDKYVEKISAMNDRGTLQWNDNYQLAFRYIRYFQHRTMSSRREQMLLLLDKLNDAFREENMIHVYDADYDFNHITCAEATSVCEYLKFSKWILDQYFNGSFSDETRAGE